MPGLNSVGLRALFELLPPLNNDVNCHSSDVRTFLSKRISEAARVVQSRIIPLNPNSKFFDAFLTASVLNWRISGKNLKIVRKRFGETGQN